MTSNRAAEDPEHPIPPKAFTFEIVGLRLERESVDGTDPFLDLSLRRGDEYRLLRFWSPADLEIERGGPAMTSGLVIYDLRPRGLAEMGVRVDDFEASPGAVDS